MTANSLEPSVQRTIAWTIAFGVIVLGLATVLAASGVMWGVVLAWMALAVGVFAGMEPGVVAWGWVLIVSRGAEEVPPKAAPMEGPPPAASPSGWGTPPTGEGPPPNASPTGWGPGAAGGEEKSKPTVEPLPELNFDWHYDELKNNPTNSARQAIEITAILVLAILAFIGSRILQGAPPFTPRPPDEQKVLDELRSDLKKCLNHACGQAPAPQPGPNPPGSNPPGPIKLDPEFQKQLLDLLNQVVKSNANNNSNSWLVPGIVALLVIVTAIVVIFLTMKKGPEAASPIGAVGLAAIVLHKVDHFSELNESTYWWTLLAFVALVGLFVILAFRVMKKEDGDRAAAAAGGAAPAGAARAGKEKAESPLSILFSLAVLVWLVLFVCYRPQPIPHPNPSPDKVTKTSYQSLDAISGFVAGSTDLPRGDLKEQMEGLAQQAKDKGAKPGDTLLFLGSADCTAVHKLQCPSICAGGCSSNKDLARCRAQVVADAFPPGDIFGPDQIQWNSLFQHESCTKSDDLRAVFPVLIQAEQ